MFTFEQNINCGNAICVQTSNLRCICDQNSHLDATIIHFARDSHIQWTKWFLGDLKIGFEYFENNLYTFVAICRSIRHNVQFIRLRKDMAATRVFLPVCHKFGLIKKGDSQMKAKFNQFSTGKVKKAMKTTTATQHSDKISAAETVRWYICARRDQVAWIKIGVYLFNLLIDKSCNRLDRDQFLIRNLFTLVFIIGFANFDVSMNSIACGSFWWVKMAAPADIEINHRMFLLFCDPKNNLAIRLDHVYEHSHVCQNLMACLFSFGIIRSESMRHGMRIRRVIECDL